MPPKSSPTRIRKQPHQPGRNTSGSPLIAFIDHGQGHTGEVLAVQLRTGNAGSNTVADHQAILAQALRGLPGADKGGCWGRKVLVRTDAAGGTKGLLNWLDKRKLSYSIGLACTAGITNIVTNLTDECKEAIIAPDGTVKDIETGFVADITAQIRSANTACLLDEDPQAHSGVKLEDYPESMRVIIRAEYPASGAQTRFLDADGRRIQVIVTNQKSHAQQIDARHRARGRCEQRVRDLKATGLMKLPAVSFASNRMWAQVAMVASNLFSWAGLLAGHENDLPEADWKKRLDHEPLARRRARWWCFEPKALRARMIGVAAAVSRHARQVIVSFDGAMDHATTLIKALARIRALP